MHRQAHPHTQSLPHLESYFNCFVSVVPSEWKRSWGPQFTRHVCRCCISNWETQAVRKNTYNNTSRKLEEYTDRLSLCLLLSHIHTLQVQHCSVLSSTASSLKKTGTSEQSKIENLLTSVSPSIKILTSWATTQNMTKQNGGTVYWAHTCQIERKKVLINEALKEQCNALWLMLPSRHYTLKF